MFLQRRLQAAAIRVLRRLRKSSEETSASLGVFINQARNSLEHRSPLTALLALKHLLDTGATVDIELVQHVFAVMTGRMQTDTEQTRDLGVAFALCEQSRNVHFARRQIEPRT